MSRNRYTRIVHKAQAAQIEQQREGLETLARELHREGAEFPVLPVINEMKERRQIRLEHNKRHKPKRSAPGTSQK